MVIEKLVSKHCIVCNVRCDKIGKHNLMEVKHQEMLSKIMLLERNNDNVPDIGDLMCRKHEKKLQELKISCILNLLLLLMLLQLQLLRLLEVY